MCKKTSLKNVVNFGFLKYKFAELRPLQVFLDRFYCYLGYICDWQIYELIFGNCARSVLNYPSLIGVMGNNGGLMGNGL